MRKDQAQERLYSALGDAIKAGPEWMAHDRESAALAIACRQMVELIDSGNIPVVKMMALCQQALRCAACGMSQSIDIDRVIEDLLKKTVPRDAN